MSSFDKIIKSDEVKNYFVHSSILIDVDGASLNNWGSDATNTQGMDNTSAVKKVFKNGRMYAVIAGQAWRYWWRESLGLNGWSLSPITSIPFYTSPKSIPIILDKSSLMLKSSSIS